MRRRHLLIASATLCAGSAPGGLANANPAYPTRPVTLVVPYPPGGPIDALARAIAQGLSERWHEAVIVDNRAGASEIIASRFVRTAAPDGHTVLVFSGALTMNPAIFKTLPYDPEGDFTPVTRLVRFTMVLAVPASAPATFADWIEYVKQRPGRLAFGVPGLRGKPHLAYVELTGATGIDMPLIPYSGLSPIVAELLGGHIDATIGALSVLRTYIAQGKLRALAIGGDERSRHLPDVPTFRELGFEDLDASFYTGLALPSKAPAQVVNQLAEDVRDVMSSPTFITGVIAPHSLEVLTDGPRECSRFLVMDRMRQVRRVKALGIQPE